MNSTYPLIVVSPDVSVSDFDGLNNKRLQIVKDISVYGEQDKDYRTVETLAYYLRTLFHRNREAITVSSHRVMDIMVAGPVAAPVDDEKHVGRVVSLTVLLSKN